MPRNKSTAANMFRMLREQRQRPPIWKAFVDMLDGIDELIREGHVTAASIGLGMCKEELIKYLTITPPQEPDLKEWEEIMQLRREKAELQLELARIRKDVEAITGLEDYLRAVEAYEVEYFGAAVEYLDPDSAVSTR